MKDSLTGGQNLTHAHHQKTYRITETLSALTRFFFRFTCKKDLYTLL